MLGLVLIVALSLAPAASAKTYDDFGEPPHSAVQYEHSDVMSSLQPYVGTVDYDTVYGTGYDYGVRLYLTERGRQCIVWGCPNVLSWTTYSVMGAPEWYNERSTASVRSEIYQHAIAGKTEVHIQYHYQDLEYWEVPYRYL